MPPATIAGHFPADYWPEPHSSDSGVKILAAVIFVIITLIFLAYLTRCIWLRCYPSALKNGLKKHVIRSLSIALYNGAASSPSSSPAECPICLTEFEEGEDVRVLPHCRHEFHIYCLDTWLGSHSTCPSCRRPVIGVTAESSAVA